MIRKEITVVEVWLERKQSSSRFGRFINLFPVIRFSNTGCVGAGGLNGTCYTEKASQKLFILIPTNNTRNALKEMELQPPPVREGLEFAASLVCHVGGHHQRTPHTWPLRRTQLRQVFSIVTKHEKFSSQCVYKMCRMNPNVILLRLDFDEFNIAQPFTCGGSSTDVTVTKINLRW